MRATQSSSDLRVARFRNWRAHPCLSHAGAVTSIQAAYRGYDARADASTRRPADSAAARRAIEASLCSDGHATHEQLVNHAAAIIQNTCREKVKERYRVGIEFRPTVQRSLAGESDSSSDVASWRRQRSGEGASKLDGADGASDDDHHGALSKRAEPRRRGESSRAARRSTESPADVAARLFQRKLRRRRDTAIFRHYKSLIDFHDSGEPAAMLRAINPGEAAMMDAASGAFVRFRLGGHTFPPAIYYKIFTRTAICDMGAFAPRNYAAVPGGDVLRNAASRHAHDGAGDEQLFMRIGRTEFRATVGNDDTGDETQRAGWYSRRENNGWRPVAPRLLEQAHEDPVTASTSVKTIDYHHSRLRRQIDRAAGRDAKRREWILRMHSEGKAQKEAERRANATVKSLTALSHSPAPPRDGGGAGRYDQEAPGARSDDDLDDMLAWADDLDFDSYSSAWSTIGTTLPARARALDSK